MWLLSAWVWRRAATEVAASSAAASSSSDSAAGGTFPKRLHRPRSRMHRLKSQLTRLQQERLWPERHCLSLSALVSPSVPLVQHFPKLWTPCQSVRPPSARRDDRSSTRGAGRAEARREVQARPRRYVASREGIGAERDEQTGTLNGQESEGGEKKGNRKQKQTKMKTSPHRIELHNETTQRSSLIRFRFGRIRFGLG